MQQSPASGHMSTSAREIGLFTNSLCTQQDWDSHQRSQRTSCELVQNLVCLSQTLGMLRFKVASQFWIFWERSSEQCGLHLFPTTWCVCLVCFVHSSEEIASQRLLGHLGLSFGKDGQQPPIMFPKLRGLLIYHH